MEQPPAPAREIAGKDLSSAERHRDYAAAMNAAPATRQALWLSVAVASLVAFAGIFFLGRWALSMPPSKPAAVHFAFYALAVGSLVGCLVVLARALRYRAAAVERHLARVVDKQVRLLRGFSTHFITLESKDGQRHVCRTRLSVSSASAVGDVGVAYTKAGHCIHFYRLEP